MKQSTAIALLGAAALAVVAVVGVIAYPYFRGTPQAENGAPPLPPDTRYFGRWGLACATDPQAGKRCMLVMRVIEQETQAMVFAARVTRGPRGNPILVSVLPPAVIVAQGVTIQPAGGQAVRAPIQSCTPQACTSIQLLTGPLVNAIAKAQSVSFRYVAANGQEVVRTLPAAGFGEGFTAWQQEFPPPASAAAAAPAPAAAAPGAPAATPPAANAPLRQESQQ